MQVPANPPPPHEPPDFPDSDAPLPVEEPPGPVQTPEDAPTPLQL